MPQEPRPRPSLAQLEKLLDELRGHTRTIRDSWHSGEAARLKMLAGRLTEMAAGSGDRVVTEMASELESVLLAEEAEASAMCERVEELIRQCKRAAGAER